MEDIIKKALNTKTLRRHGSGGGGSINTGQGYETDHGIVYVKCNSGSKARLMFEGEAASLNEIIKTSTVQVPKPFHVFDQPTGGAALIMEYAEINSLSKHAKKLGEQLARMHLHNEELRRRLQKQESSVHKDEDAEYVNQFGFHIPTCCGYIAQDNSWKDDWITYYTRNKLQQQLDLIDKEYGDREARELWSKLQRVIPDLFGGMEIFPSLVHGDLWGGNVGENTDGPVIFDPACFYGHHEFELGIAKLFGGISPSVFNSYHSIIPKAEGFDKRNKLYQLFHYLNHWNHFGGSYRGSSLSIMRELSKT